MMTDLNDEMSDEEFVRIVHHLNDIRHSTGEDDSGRNAKGILKMLRMLVQSVLNEQYISLSWLSWCPMHVVKDENIPQPDDVEMEQLIELFIDIQQEYSDDAVADLADMLRKEEKER